VIAVAVQGKGLVDPMEPVFRADDEAILRGAQFVQRSSQFLRA